MKCQKCGRDEVNFHYSSDINGHVTQTHLCSQCATESGYNIDQLFGDMFTGMIPVRSINRAMSSYIPAAFFMPGAIPVMKIGSGFPLDTGVQPKNTCQCGCETATPKINNIEVDEKLKQKRELQIQMRTAVQKEDFGKAAELRDMIKKLET